MEKSKTGNQKQEIKNRKSKKREDKEKRKRKKNILCCLPFFSLSHYHFRVPHSVSH
jgi:hypothetical protein